MFVLNKFGVAKKFNTYLFSDCMAHVFISRYHEDAQSFAQIWTQLIMFLLYKHKFIHRCLTNEEKYRLPAIYSAIAFRRGFPDSLQNNMNVELYGVARLSQQTYLPSRWRAIVSLYALELSINAK